mgnify:CR=1 FL=1
MKGRVLKRYAHLLDKIVAYENLYLAFQNAQKAKRQKNQRTIAYVARNFDKLSSELIQKLETETWENGAYTTFTLCERGKERIIHRLPFWPDRVLHHAICQILVPIWRPTLILDTSASIKGRGVHFTAKRVRKWIRTDPEGTQYCLQIDVRKFYPSVNHDILLDVLRGKIKDAKLLRLLEIIIRSVDYGVPIGNYLSQWLANLYLNELDHLISSEPKAAHYHRYCDDIVVFSNDPEYLHQLRQRAETWLRDKRRLAIKPTWQVFKLTANRPLNFCGYVFYPNKTLIRKPTKKRMVKALKVEDQSVRGAYLGWLSFGSCYTLCRLYLLKGN